MENPVIIFGAKDMGVTALEAFQSNNNLVYGFLDDDVKLQQTDVHLIPVLGSTEDETYLKLLGKKCDAFVAIENTKARQAATEMLLDSKVMPVNAIHARAYVSPMALLGHGNLIAPNAVINAGASIGSHTFIHANAVVDNGAVIGDFVHIGAGSVVNTGAIIEDGVFIGSGVTIVSGVTIAANARVGAGSVVMNNVKKGQIVFGVPAVEVKN